MGRTLVEELVQAAQLRMQTQGEFSQYLLDDMMDEIIDEFMRDGLITDDEDVAAVKVEVKKRLERETV